MSDAAYGPNVLIEAVAASTHINKDRLWQRIHPSIEQFESELTSFVAEARTIKNLARCAWSSATRARSMTTGWGLLVSAAVTAQALTEPRALVGSEKASYATKMGGKRTPALGLHSK